MKSVETLSMETEEHPGDQQANVEWRSFWLILLIVALPMMMPYLSTLWSNEHYRFGVFALLAVGWLTYARWDRRFGPPRGWLSWAAIGFGSLAVAMGCLLFSPWLAAVGAVAFATAFLASIEGERDVSLIGLALPLFLLIRLPLGYDQILIIRLQQITTSLASVLLDVMAVPHAVSNNVLQLTTRELFVAEACSGIQSVFTMLFLASLLIVVNRRPLWLLPVYVLIGAVLAITANVVRVTTVAVGDVWFDVDLAKGWQHELVGYTALLLGALLLLSSDQLLRSLLHRVEPTDSDAERNLIIEFWNFMVGNPEKGTSTGPITVLLARAKPRGAKLWETQWSRRGMMAVFAVLAVASLGQAINLFRPIEILPSREIVYEPAADIFDGLRLDPIELVGREQSRGGSNERLGENADIWYWKSDSFKNEGQVVLSQPYPGWHELCHCYAVTGWVLLNRVVRDNQPEGDIKRESAPPAPFAVARFKVGNDYAYLFYSGIDAQGNVVKPLPTLGRLSSRFMDNFYGPEQLSRVMMLQMLMSDSEVVNDAKLRSLASAFLKMRGQIQSRVRGQQADQRDGRRVNSPEDLQASTAARRED